MGKLIILMLFLISLLGCQNIDGIKSPEKVISVLSENQVFLEGRWKKISSITKQYRITPKINTTLILCNKGSGSCVEHAACLVTGKDSPWSPYSRLYIQPTDYFITEWSDSVIKAKYEARAGDVELRISLADKSAEKSFRETSARGAHGANPNLVENWILE